MMLEHAVLGGVKKVDTRNCLHCASSSCLRLMELSVSAVV